ncbi:unnamed protein product, partial [Adineta steineri]
MTTHTTISNQSLKQTDDDDNAVEPEETRHVTISEAIGLDFNSFIPQA